ncbi:MAG: MFS transporter [Bacteroidaceae bacterium]|nr:MFS transporter [Bacteroidaceae bacterium]
MTNEKNNGKLIAIITMCFIFAMISFVTNMGAPFGNIWGQKYEFAASWGNLMNFTAYLFMGVPSGMLLKKIGYKKTALYALILGIVGLAVQYLSSLYGEGVAVNEIGGVTVCLNLYIYMLGALICGVCVCMLNTVVNPMLNLLGGGGNKGNQLIQVGGTLNSLTATLTPMLAGILVGTVTENTSMSDVSPLLFIGMAVFAISFVIISRVSIPEPNLGKQDGESMTNLMKGALKFRHMVLGIIAIFFYVGVEIGIPMHLNFYVTNLGFEGSAAIGGSLAAAYWFMMLIGRFCSTLISGKVSTSLQMTVVSTVAIALLLIAIFLPETTTLVISDHEVPMKVIFIAACGLCTSIMWGGIFNLSVEGLGKYTEAASGLFMMMVVGGGLMPWLQDVIAKASGSIPSYWLQVAMLAYILFYSVIGCKNVNKDIKVD